MTLSRPAPDEPPASKTSSIIWPSRSAADRLRVEPGALMPVSNDMLLRVVRRRGRPSPPPPTVIGIDDWAWKRNQRYGAIICDLGRRRPIKLLPDREPATAQAWLAGQPQIAIVARDRGGGFALAASRALPGALQVADRWHLMETPAPPSSAPCANRCAAYDPRSERRSSTRHCSPPRRSFNTRAICAAKKSTPLFLRGPSVARRSKRSCGRRAIVAGSFERFCAASARKFSVRGRVHSSRIFHGSTRNGPPAVTMALNCGDVSKLPAFVDPCASSPNGRAGAAARKRWTRLACIERPRRGPLHA